MGQCFLAAAEHLAGGDESTPDKGIAKIAEIKAQSFPGSSSTITTLLTSGSAWAIPWLNGRSWALIDQGLPFAYVLPKEGGYRGMTKIDVVAGSKHREAALAYINEVLGPLSQLGMVFEFPYGPTNKLLAPILAAYPEISKKFPASPEDLNSSQAHQLASIQQDASKGGRHVEPQSEVQIEHLKRPYTLRRWDSDQEIAPHAQLR